MQIKCMPNLGSIRVVAVKHHHAPNWEPHLSCPVPRLAWDGKNFRFFGKNFRFSPKTGVAKRILGEKTGFLAVLGTFSPSLQRNPESDGGDSWTVTATLSPDDSEFLTAAHPRVLLRAPLEPFFVRARHRSAAVLAAGVHDRGSSCC